MKKKDIGILERLDQMTDDELFEKLAKCDDAGLYPAIGSPSDFLSRDQAGSMTTCNAMANRAVIMPQCGEPYGKALGAP
ncbi:hypothetical protein phiV208_13 [Vibrio phage phiV208]|nr:hypothetical protein phiV208_13 [Vibrio phage phiV208]